jgi:hypothetical protein
MNPIATTWSLCGIGVCVFTMRAFMNDSRAKGITFSRSRFVVRSYSYSAIPLAATLGTIAYLCHTYTFEYSPRPDISRADYAMPILFIWSACALVFLLLFLARAHHRAMKS